jgi:hypothetical protein
MKLLLVSDFYYIDNEIYLNIHSFTIKLMEIYSNFERTQPILWKYSESSYPILRFIKNYTQYMKEFFGINKILSKLITVYTLYLVKFKLIFIDIKLKLTNVNQILIDFKVI